MRKLLDDFFNDLAKAFDQTDSVGRAFAAVITYFVIFGVWVTTIMVALANFWPLGIVLSVYAFYRMVSYALHGRRGKR